MNTSNLKPFRLEDFKSNDETPVVHKTGQRAFIAVHPHPESIDKPVAAFFAETRTSDTYRADGCYRNSSAPNLFFAPRKKVVPLSLEDIKPGMAFRAIKGVVIAFPTTAYQNVVEFRHYGLCSFTELQRHYEYSFDCLTWHRCEKEVDA